MTHTSPEFSIAPECVGPIDLAAASRHLKHDRRSRQEIENTFESQFSRCRKLLQFIALRILNCADEAEQAVRNCHLTASCNPPNFSSEGAFKSWLLRILMDEATLLLRNRQSDPTASSNRLVAGR